MKLIMFNNRYGLTQSVLDGRKTHTRRISKAYDLGEEVAIAQCYKDIADYLPTDMIAELKKTKGWTNKMFVRADLMPHRIKITDLRCEMLQDISDEDCISEGVEYRPSLKGYIVDGLYLSRTKNMPIVFLTAKAAFAALIDKISGKGTWNSNPVEYVYEMELIKNEKIPIRITEESSDVYIPVGNELEFEGVVFSCEKNERLECCERCDARTLYNHLSLCARVRCYRCSRKDGMEVHFVKKRTL